MNKETLLMEQIIVKFHPQFKESTQLQDLGLLRPEIFNVEMLVEECLAACGPYELSRGCHQDFSDGSDCKTASIRREPNKPGTASHKGEISGVQTSAGVVKLGALRCVVYNPCENNLLYFYLPKEFWTQNIDRHPTTGMGRIFFTYNRNTMVVPKLIAYQVNNFEELAQTTG